MRKYVSGDIPYTCYGYGARAKRPVHQVPCSSHRNRWHMNIHPPKVLTHARIYMIMNYTKAFPTKKKTPYCFCSFFKNLMHFFFKTTHRPMFLAEFLDEAQLHPARCSPAPVPVSPSNRWPKSPATWPGPVTAFHGWICGKLDPPKG